MFDFFKKKEEEPKDFKKVLAGFKDLEKKVKEISQGLEDIKKENLSSFQKIGVVRYNPFSGVGGDQSFSVALLDGDDNGVVITGLYTREGNRVYAKPIKKGESEYSLSEEEQKALSQAIEK